MRDKMLGRWMARLVVTAGAGVIALGISPIAAHAGVVSPSAVFAPQIRTITLIGSAGLVKAQPEPIFVTEDFGWD